MRHSHCLNCHPVYLYFYKTRTKPKIAIPITNVASVIGTKVTTMRRKFTNKKLINYDPKNLR